MNKSNFFLVLTLFAIALSSLFYFLTLLKMIVSSFFYNLFVDFMFFGIFLSFVIVIMSLVMKKNLDKNKYRISFFANLLSLLALILFLMFSIFNDRVHRPSRNHCVWHRATVTANSAPCNIHNDSFITFPILKKPLK